MRNTLIHITLHQYITMHNNAWHGTSMRNTSLNTQHFTSIHNTAHQCIPHQVNRWNYTSMHNTSHQLRAQTQTLLHTKSFQSTVIYQYSMYLVTLLDFAFSFKISTCIVHTLRLVILIILRTLISYNFYFLISFFIVDLSHIDINVLSTN